MKLTIEPTDRIVTLASRGGAEIQARVWEGADETGVKVHLFIARVAVHDSEPEAQARFAAELQECARGRPATGPWDLRMFID